MSIYKKFGLLSSSFILRSGLFFGFTLLAAVMVMGNRENIKNALVQVNAYDRFSQSIIDTGKDQVKNDPAAIPLDDPKIQEMIKQSFSTDTFMGISEDFIDGTYDWLEGKSPNIAFTADLQSNKQVFATGVANYATERLITLPACKKIPTESNIFKIDCQPAYLDVSKQRKAVYETIMQDESIIKNRPITTADLPKTSEGKSLTDQYAKLPTYYKWFRYSPWIIFGVTFIAALLYVVLHKSKRLGIKTIATSLIGTGIVMIIAPLLYNYVLPNTGLELPGFGESGSETVSAISSDVMDYFYSQFNTTIINISIQIAAAGVLLLIVVKFLKPTPNSIYHDLEKKSGLANSFENSKAGTGTSLTSADIPIQTSEEPLKAKTKKSDLEKKLGKM